MLNESKIISFVATKSPASAREFYERTLGLPLVSADPFALVFRVNGAMLRVAKVQELTPAEHTVLGWDVEDIQTAITELSRRGVHFERYADLPQDEQNIWTSPVGAKVAWFKDGDGNTLSLTQF